MSSLVLHHIVTLVQGVQSGPAPVGWVDLDFESSIHHYLPDFAWADGNLAEGAGLLGKMVENPN